MPKVRTDRPEQFGEPLGLVCGTCGSHQFRALYVRPRPNGVIMRRRECRKCGTRITTREREQSRDFRP